MNPSEQEAIRRAVAATEWYHTIDLGDGIVHELDRSLAMAAFVSRRFLQRSAGLPQMLERRLHVRLIGGGPSCDEAGGDDEGEKQSGHDSTSGHVFPPVRIRLKRIRFAYRSFAMLIARRRPPRGAELQRRNE